jgi:hypothetical protein
MREAQVRGDICARGVVLLIVYFGAVNRREDLRVRDWLTSDEVCKV